MPCWVSLLAGFAGVVVVLLGGAGGVGWSAWELVVAVAAIGWAGGTVWASRSATLPGPRAATVLQLMAGGLSLLVLGVAVGEPARLAPGSAG